MFEQPGTLYVYSIHSCWCMNVVSEREGCGAAVLLRALEPIDGVEHMLQNRPVEDLKSLTNGPGKLCQALCIDRRHDGIDLVTYDRLWIEQAAIQPRLSIVRSPRIGIREGTELMYRFFVDANRFVSGPARYHTASRSQSIGRHS